MESKLPGTAINGTAHPASLLFSKAPQALNHQQFIADSAPRKSFVS
jgi:hypothetical protein